MENEGIGNLVSGWVVGWLVRWFVGWLVCLFGWLVSESTNSNGYKCVCMYLYKYLNVYIFTIIIHITIPKGGSLGLGLCSGKIERNI